MDASTWLDSYERRLTDVRARAGRAQAALAEITSTVTSRDGAVTVTVSPAGALQGLVLTERADALSRSQLAETVLATARRAQGEAAARVADAVAPLIGGRSAAMGFLRSQLPVPVGER